MDWKAVDAGLAVDEAQTRWASMTAAISKRRTMLEIARAAQRQFELAKIHVRPRYCVLSPSLCATRGLSRAGQRPAGRPRKAAAAAKERAS